MSYLEDAKVLFGDMRNLTKEEQEAYSKGLDEISEDTGITLFDYEPRKIVKVKGKVTKVSRADENLTEDNISRYEINFEDYIGVVDTFNGDKEILHIEYDEEMEYLIQDIEKLFKYLNEQ